MKIFREHLTLKIVSLILAVGVWMYVRGEDKPVQIVTAPLELQNLDASLAISGEVTQAVSIRVRGPDVRLRALDAEPLLARADLSALSEGEQFVRITPGSVRIPPGIEVLQITPEHIPIRIEKKIHTNLPVRAQVAGEPAPGFVLGEIRVQPERVTVEGPESALAGAREVKTDPVRIDGRVQPFTVAVDLFSDAQGVVVLSGGTAVLSIDIHERYVRRVIQAVAVTGVDGAASLRIEPPVVDVMVEGIPEDVYGLEAGGLIAVVDLDSRELAEGTESIQAVPRVELGDPALEGKVFVRSVDPEKVTLKAPSGRGR